MYSRYVSLRWLFMLVGIVVLLAGCVGGPLPANSQPTGFNIRGSVSKADFDTPERMCGAILVVDAEIAGLGAAHWNTPTGARPAVADEQEIVRGGYEIRTPLHFSNMHTYVDHRRQPTSEFVTIGGQVGPDQYWMGGYPQVTLHQRYLLVLVKAIDRQAQAESETVLLVTDAFSIDGQGIVTLHAAHDEGKGADIQHFPAVTMPLSQITQQLASCK